MKLMMRSFFRQSTWLIALLVFWSVWTEAQQPAAPAAIPSPARADAARPFDLDLPPAEKGVWLTFGLDRIEILRTTKVAAIPLWQYLASIIYIFLTFYVAKFLDLFAGAYLKKWAEKTQTKFDDLLAGLIQGPIKVVAFVILLQVGLTALDWPATIRVYLSRVLTVVVAVSFTYASIRATDLLIGQWRRRSGSELDRTFNDQFLPFIRTILRVFIVVIAAVMTLDSLKVEVKGLITGLGIGGLAFALAAQDTVANLFGAVAVFVDKPFQVGDAVRVESIEGTVEAIGLRSTRVRHPDGHLITVPNKTMGSATITNMTRRPHSKTTMNLGITYDTPLPKVKEALEILDHILRSHPMTHDVIISFNKFGDSALNFQVIHWFKSTDLKTYSAGIQELNLAIKERFDRAGINFAFPTQTLHLKQD